MGDIYLANFSTDKAGLSTVETAFFDSNNIIMGSWVQNATELITDTGIYFADLVTSDLAYRLGWRTQDSPERFLLLALKVDALTFNFGIQNTGKSIAYQFIDNVGVLIGAEITADVLEFQSGTGIYLAKNVVIPSNAEMVQARTVETVSVFLASTLDRLPVLLSVQVSKDGPYIEEVDIS